MRLIRSFIFTLLLAAFIMGVFPAFNSIAYATNATISCDGDKITYEKIQVALPSVDIRRTSSNMLVATLVDAGIILTTGNNVSHLQKCGAEAIQNAEASIQIPPGCVVTSSEQCADLNVVWAPGTNFADSQVAGSLLGLSNFFEGAAVNQPIPVNLAYWWNDSVARVPFAGKALAQTVNYSGPFLETILIFWKLTRNIAYGLMSLVMLAIGIMIITKKKIGSQLAVTAQMALPRIVIALFLITFSYAIGATGASLAYVMQGNVVSLLSELDWASIGQSGATVGGIGYIAAIILVVLGTLSGVGVVLLILYIILVILILVLGLLAWLKFFMVYLKILFSIITAPLTFALGAVPGSETNTVNWFKQFLARIIALPAIHFVIYLSMYFAAGVAISTFRYGGLGAYFAGQAIAVLIIPLILVYGFTLARGIPEKIETMIMGEEKKRR